MKVICGIYKITNLINNKCYIGQSVNIYKRWIDHKKPCTIYGDKNKNLPLYKAFRKYGLNNFKFQILEECKKKDLNKREKYWAEYYKSYTHEFGYNIAFCGEGKEKYSYNKLSEDKFNEIVALLKTTNMAEINIAEKFGVSLITINQINTGHTLFHENINYPIRKYKDPKYCKYCHKKLYSDNTSGYCKDCLNYFHTLPYSEQIKYIPSNLSTSPFIPNSPKELFIFLYYNPFSVVAKHYSTTKKKILIYLQHNNIPNIVEDYRIWFENNYQDYLPKDNKQEIVRKIYVQKSLDNSYIAEYASVSEAARSINKGIYNHGAHIKAAAISGNIAYGYKWELKEIISYKYSKIYPDNCFL